MAIEASVIVSLFLQHAHSLRAPLDEQQLATIVQYGSELEEVNQTMNLTRIPAAEYLTLHVLDSLMVAAVVDLAAAKSLLDIGTGAGFPAVPLAVAFPHLRIAAMDARKKKLVFIQEAAAKLRIKNITVQHARAEQEAVAPRIKQYDVVCSRALANYTTLLNWQLPFVAPAGCAVMLKSVAQEAEIAKEPPRGWSQEVVRLVLPGTGMERLLVVVRRDGK